MKTSILRMFALPLAAFALASAGAVSTNESSKSKTSVSVTPYIHTPADDSCLAVDVNCSPGGGQACEYSGFTAYGKPTAGACNQTLHRN